MKVYISPSSQWHNIVADGAHSEAKHCTDIALAAKKYLEANGYQVKVGDNSEQTGTMENRVYESNKWKANLHLCIHTNAGGGEGTEMLAYPASVNNKYVKNIYKEVASLTPTKDRGIKSRSDLYEINRTNCVCAYLECDFHDNKKIENWIDDNVDNIGKSIAKGICLADKKVFKEKKTSKPINTSKPSQLFKVQCGAFKSKTNAEKLVNELKNKGFNAFYYKGE